RLGLLASSSTFQVWLDAIKEQLNCGEERRTGIDGSIAMFKQKKLYNQRSAVSDAKTAERTLLLFLAIICVLTNVICSDGVFQFFSFDTRI
uniref:PH domain-containing protein n=1 Tax=Parascaris univalens TaxID=6257 RepID=A0A915C7D5_PARUN